MSAERKQILLRIDPAMHEALARWASDDLRSVNAQIEWVLTDALTKAGRKPAGLRPPNPRGRPRKPPDHQPPDVIPKGA
jgi:hypothetical protein